MDAPLTKTTGLGTIDAIRPVRVEATSTLYAMVIPDDGGGSRLAIRIGPKTMAKGSEAFVVGDKVRFTLLAGEFPKARDLVKLQD